jgi:hypothetical protein
MISLSDLLSKYKNLVPTDSLKKEAAILIIDKLFEIKLEKKDLSVSNNIIYLKTSSKLKSEVFIHKAEILRELKEILKQNAPKDIK